MTFSSLNACNKQQKLPDTIKASMVAIRKDPIFLEYINCKKKLLYGMAYNEWNISIENIHALSQDSTSIKNSKDLYNLYKRYFLDPKFTYLIEKVSNLSKEIKNKYEVHKFKSLWKELNQAEYSKIVINEARIAFVSRISNQAGKADSCVKYMALCNKSWETLKQNSL